MSDTPYTMPVEIDGTLLALDSIVEIGPIKQRENWHFFKVVTRHGTQHEWMIRTKQEAELIRIRLINRLWPMREVEAEPVRPVRVY